MTLLQSAIFDTGEMATAIAAWKEKRSAEFARADARKRRSSVAIARAGHNEGRPCE